MKTVYDVGLGHEEFKARGESGEYHADLGRYFLDGMCQPPVVGGAEPSASPSAVAPVRVDGPAIASPTKRALK